jgi:hypothetical protein
MRVWFRTGLLLKIHRPELLIPSPVFHLIRYNLLGLAPGDQGVAVVGVVGDHPVGPVKGLGEPAGGHRQLAGSLGVGDAGAKASPRGIPCGILGVVEHVDRVAPETLPGLQPVLGRDAEAPFGGGVKVLGLLVDCLVVIVVVVGGGWDMEHEGD